MIENLQQLIKYLEGLSLASSLEKLRSVINGVQRDTGVDLDAAEDAVVAAVTKLFFAVANGLICKNPEGWLRTTASWKALDGRRAQEARAKAREKVAEMPSGAPVTPFMAAIENETDNALRCAIAGLKLNLRSVVELRLEGHEFETIAAMLGIKPDNARQRHKRAVEQLQKILTNRIEGPCQGLVNGGDIENKDLRTDVESAS